jgi:hypothetical protein
MEQDRKRPANGIHALKTVPILRFPDNHSRDREHFGWVPVSKIIGRAGHSVLKRPNVPFPAHSARTGFERRSFAGLEWPHQNVDF